MEKIVMATQNKDKLREMRAILEPYGFELLSMGDVGLENMEIVEDGETFEENSLIKASAVAAATGLTALADDSGLMVDALDGAPGVYSARYAGEGCTYADNNRKLLEALKDTPPEARGAHFVTVITLLEPGGEKLVARGECFGRIAGETRGEGGFGYDPLFIPDGYEHSFAEMGAAVKNSISHRSRALRKLEGLLAAR